MHTLECKGGIWGLGLGLNDKHYSGFATNWNNMQCVKHLTGPHEYPEKSDIIM